MFLSVWGTSKKPTLHICSVALANQAEADEERLKAEEEEGIEVKFWRRATSPASSSRAVIGGFQQDGPKSIQLIRL